MQYLEEPSASTGNDLLVHRQVAVSIGQGLCVGTRGDKKLRSADNDPAAQAISATNVTKQVVHGKLDGLLGGHTDQIGADAWSTHTHTHTHRRASNVGTQAQAPVGHVPRYKPPNPSVAMILRNAWMGLRYMREPSVPPGMPSAAQ